MSDETPTYYALQYPAQYVLAAYGAFVLLISLPAIIKPWSGVQRYFPLKLPENERAQDQLTLLQLLMMLGVACGGIAYIVAAYTCPCIPAIGVGIVIAGYLYPNTGEELTDAVEEFEKR